MSKKTEVKLVLFVCTGNSCRSVIAQNLFEKMVAEEGLSQKIKVASAGTAVRLGFKPIRGTVKVLKEEGIDVKGYRARKLKQELVARADLIVVMEKRHRQNLIEKFPVSEGKTFLINQFLPEENFLDLPDPIGKSIKVYKATTEHIKQALPGILKRVREI